ncbi:hypothetical protein [Streptomyces sp. URMC 129]|uniref:hypothetical protein n=1 Tax=Streptomyces sp. URMC 129 TaxID=3423407 RepID=UPI003F1BCF6B
MSGRRQRGPESITVTGETIRIGDVISIDGDYYPVRGMDHVPEGTRLHLDGMLLILRPRTEIGILRGMPSVRPGR